MKRIYTILTILFLTTFFFCSCIGDEGTFNRTEDENNTGNDNNPNGGVNLSSSLLDWDKESCEGVDGKWLDDKCWYIGQDSEEFTIGLENDDTFFKTAYLLKDKISGMTKYYLEIVYKSRRPSPPQKDMRLPAIKFRIPLHLANSGEKKDALLNSTYSGHQLSTGFETAVDKIGSVETKMSILSGQFSPASITIENIEDIDLDDCYSTTFADANQTMKVGTLSGNIDISGNGTLTASGDEDTNLAFPFKFITELNIPILPHQFKICSE